MARWRKVMVWLVLLWLPVQGYAAGFMPFACHKQDAAPTVSAPHESGHHDAHAHHATQETAPADGLNHDVACDDCNLCQLCGAPALTALPQDGAAPQHDGIALTTTYLLQSFIPPLPHRPPRVRLA